MGVLAVLLFMSVLIAQSHGFCCFLHQWEGVRSTTAVSFNSASQYFIQGTETISFDFTNGFVAVIERYQMNGLKTKVHYIRDFNQKLLFQIINDGLCTVTNLPGNLNRPCIPDAAQPTGQFYIGVGNNTYELEGYSLKISVGVRAFLVVTKPDNDACIPVQETVNSGLPGANGMMTSSYTNMTEGIKDPNVFVPPPHCSHKKVTRFRKDSHHVESLHKYTRPSVVLNF